MSAASLVFQKALAEHIDKHKDIDPIAKAQLQSLSLEWIIHHNNNHHNHDNRQTDTEINDDDDDHDDDHDGDDDKIKKGKEKENGKDLNYSAATPSLSPPKQSTTTRKQRRINGTLQISNDHIVLSFHSSCEWEWQDHDDDGGDGDNDDTNNDDENDGKPKKGKQRQNDSYRKMNFQIYVSARFSTPPNSTISTSTNTIDVIPSSSLLSSVPATTRRSSNSKNNNSRQQQRKEQRRNDKIRAGIQKRMMMDAYIHPLLRKGGGGGIDGGGERRKRSQTNVTDEDDEDDAELERVDGLLLCEGMVQQGMPKLETTCTKQPSSPQPILPFLAERVYVSEHALEGIQRALFSELAVTTISLVPDGTSSTTISASGGTTNDTEDNDNGNNHNNNNDTNDDDDGVGGGGGHTNITIMQLLLDMPYLPRPHSSRSMTAAAYYKHCLKLLGATTRSSRTATATEASSGSSSTTDLSVENHSNNPKLSRGGISSGGDEEGQERIANMLAERIALRLLEDVTVDACVKEGEDELLGQLNLMDDDTHDEDEELEQKHRPPHGKKAQRR